MADTSKISQSLKELQDFYGRKLPDSAIVKWAQKLRFIDSRDLQVAVDDVTSNERQFPTPDVVLKYADQAKSNRAFREQQRERDSMKRLFDSGDHNSGLAKECAEFVQMVYRFRPGSREKYEFEIGWCQQMQNNYPHLANEFKLQEREARTRLAAIPEKAKESAA